MNSAGGSIWTVDRRSKLQWRCLDGEWIVYSPGPAQTHQLDALSAAVLGQIEAGAAQGVGTDALGAWLAQTLESADPVQVDASLNTVLAQLQSVGLIQPAP